MPSRVSTAPLTVPWSWAATASRWWSWRRSTGVRSAGEASHARTSVMGPLVLGRGQEQGGERVGRGGAPEIALVALVDRSGHEVPGQSPGPGEVAGVAEDVPPHVLPGVRDLL